MLIEGQKYINLNGSTYTYIGDNWFVSNGHPAWKFQVDKINTYDDGRIDWNHSFYGHFVEDKYDD